ncbi:MAG TPA: SDR family oxidoreductase [Woeseiaceae bacterium]|nr:SDR family oxidoreductase [Woeseiaceae bacterium]
MANTLRLYALKAIVTGAADGIGEAIARTFAKHGAEVLAVDSPQSRIGTVFGKVRGITALEVDEETEELSGMLLKTARERLEGLDILVNNFPSLSDTQAPGGNDEPNLQPWLDQVLAATAAVLPLLRKSPAGRIINIGALRSSFSRDDDAGFAAAERALSKVTAAQAAEHGTSGITANYIQPGAIMTADSRAIFEADKAFRDWCIQRSAARRLGEPVDIAKVALFLASDDSVFVSGTGIAADGGLSPDAD